MLFGSFEKNFPPLSDKMRSSLRKRFSEVETITVIEILMVSNDVFFHIHFCLVEIFACWQKVPFAGMTVTSVGIFHNFLH